MPRLLGVDIPNDRKAVISLTYLYGVGNKTARDLCHKADIDENKKARDLTDRKSVDFRRFWNAITPWKVHFDDTFNKTSTVCVTLSATAASVTEWAYLFVGNERKQMPAHVKDPRKPLPVRRVLRIFVNYRTSIVESLFICKRLQIKRWSFLDSGKSKKETRQAQCHLRCSAHQRDFQQYNRNDYGHQRRNIVLV